MEISGKEIQQKIDNGEKLILPELTGLRIVSDTADSLDSTISYVEIS